MIDTKELRRLLAEATAGEWMHGSALGGWDAVAEARNPKSLVCMLSLNNPANASAIAALHNAAPALIAAAREVERLRAFVPVWTPVGNPDGDWRLSLGARELARVCPCGGGRWYPSNAATLDFATIGEAAAAVCARLGIPSVEVGDV